MEPREQPGPGGRSTKAQTRAEATLASWNGSRARPRMPAKSGTRARAGPKNRPSATAAMPQRPMKASALAMSSG